MSTIQKQQNPHLKLNYSAGVVYPPAKLYTYSLSKELQVGSKEKEILSSINTKGFYSQEKKKKSPFFTALIVLSAIAGIALIWKAEVKGLINRFNVKPK